MELKKSPKADLESKRNVYFMLGLVISLGIILLAFEWTAKPKKADSLGSIQALDVEEEIIPITREQEIKPPPPPPPPKVVEVLNIVDDDVDIDDELHIDTEADDRTLITVAPVISAKKEEEEEEQQVFFIVEDMPEFPGGEMALRTYIASAIKYPVIAQENGIQGRVICQFVVNRDGSIVDVEVVRSVDPSLDKEAIRVIKSMPKWSPGKQRGKPVRVKYTLPVNFKLQ